MKLKEFGLYTEAIKQCIKRNLEYEVKRGFDEKLIRIKKYYDVENFDDSEFQNRMLNASKEKTLVEKVLNDKNLLDIYLDSEVRKNICRLLRLSASGPEEELSTEKAIKAFKVVGFRDVDEYFLGIDSVENLRRDLYEQAGLEYIPYEKLKRDLEIAREDFDYDSFSIAKTNFIKAGIDYITGYYTAKEYFTCEVAVFTDEQVRLLSSNNSCGTVK
ncbi:MAG: hypothetical protein HFE81_04495 [Bacilli bacterium]|nr:hypothetical protein [Bacilli bacterium]